MSVRVILRPKLRAQFEREARAAFPRECCGLLEGRRDGDGTRIEALHPARNLSPAPDAFEIVPADHFAAQRAARSAGRDIVGCYHSHPDGRAEPSPRDRAGAAEAGFVWLIAAPDAAAGVALAAYVFDGEAFMPATLSPSASLDPARNPRV